MEYFTPETLAIVYLLHESAQPPCEFDPNTTLASFIVNRIRVNYWSINDLNWIKKLKN